MAIYVCEIQSYNLRQFLPHMHKLKNVCLKLKPGSLCKDSKENFDTWANIMLVITCPHTLHVNYNVLDYPNINKMCS